MLFGPIYQLTLNKCLLMMAMLCNRIGTTVCLRLGRSTFFSNAYWLIPFQLIKINIPEVTQEFG